MTTPGGNLYHPFDLCKLVRAAGAAYVARYSVTQPVALINAIIKAITTEGFSFLDVMSPCPTQFGRRNQQERPEDMIQDLMRRCIMKEDAAGLSEEELADRIVTGDFS